MADLSEDDGREIMSLFIKEVKRRLRDEPQDLKAADFEMLRKLLSDNSITFASVRQGSFGDYAKRVAEEFPFQDEAPRFQ